MRIHWTVLAFAFACGGPQVVEPQHADVPHVVAPPRNVVISIVGTNDVHGQVEQLPFFAGYVRNVREARARDGGGVLLIDGGDIFQGTLESNLQEGAAMIQAYNVIGYGAATVGNHEFDFGPVGPATTPENPGDDPRGALRARAAEAAFPMLSANLLVAESGGRVSWPPIVPSTVIEVAGVRVGVLGVTTEQTLSTTLAANVEGLRVQPLADAITEQAAVLRSEGATVIVVVAHAGGRCEHFDDPRDLSSCDPEQEIFRVARALLEGTADVVVAGHTHGGVAHFVNGAAVIESFAYGRAFGRVDLTIDAATGRVSSVDVRPPQETCVAGVEPCAPSEYEGAAVVRDESVAAVLEPFIAGARELRGQLLGVEVDGEFEKDSTRETALGNLIADLMLDARPDAQVAIVNGGGIRTPLHAGPLTYGELFELLPFDNRFARARMTARELAETFRANLAGMRGVLSIAGARVVFECRGVEVAGVHLERTNGRRIPDATELGVLTSDFVATGGDALLGPAAQRPGAVTLERGRPIRDDLADVLRHRGGVLRPTDRRLNDPRRPRIVRCGDAT